jgi:hypothetical protein
MCIHAGCLDGSRAISVTVPASEFSQLERDLHHVTHRGSDRACTSAGRAPVETLAARYAIGSRDPEFPMSD